VKRWHGLVLLGSLVGLAGCNQQRSAEEAFSKDRSCPVDKVAATPRPSLSIYDLTFGKVAGEPPKDIAQDPERRALWQAKQDESKRVWDKTGTLYEVAGCGEKKYYVCGRARRASSCSSLTATPP
jgi:hypothetical protein